MIVFGMVGIILGFGLATRFKVFILVPVQIAVLSIASICLALHLASFDSVLQNVCVCSVGLQAGYLFLSALHVQRRLVLVAAQRKL